MLFNSLEFALFLPLVFAIYWGIGSRNIKGQNLFLLIASYVFYGWWDWRFLFLILFSSLVDYTIGLRMGGETRKARRKGLLAISLGVNLGLLGVLKYYNFFAESFSEAFTLLGQQIQPDRLEIILPVGISFYTFQTLSYSIDIYRNNLSPSRDAISFFAFVSFFPQLVAGPIERATHLLPQFKRERKFDYEKSADGLRQILWGLFKKMVIADNCAYYVNEIFSNYDTLTGSTLFLGGVLFAFQIYGDFSGYSDIAIGTSRLFGFSLMRNFAFPYFSRDIAEFWRRWHISLSTWFRDYLYIPLGGSKGSLFTKVRNIFIIFLVSGFWHGANYTFIIWGALNALYFLPLMLFNLNRKNTGLVAENRILPSLKELVQISITFVLTVIAWIFFRAESVSQAMDYLTRMASPTLISYPRYFNLVLIASIAVFLIVEWFQRDKEHGLEQLEARLARPVRWGVYLFLFLATLSFGGEQQEFIYFQF